MAADRPEVRLLPKADARLIRRGFPWVYANQLVMDRRTRAIAPGTPVVLLDAERRVLGLAAFNPNSKIAARLLDPDAAAEVDEAWFARRLARALALREALFDSPHYRLVHAEADGLPGVIIDRFGEAAVIQPNAAWAETRIGDLAAALRAVTGVRTVVRNTQGRARELEGLEGESAVLSGALTGPLEVPMNGALYLADLAGGQKTGLFYDQRPNHAFAARLARGRRVLDVFSHVGGFALAALAAGAGHALAVDGSEAALSLAREGARRSGLDGRFATRKGDAFAVMAELTAADERFGLVICDPPAFAPSREALEAGLRAYEKIARLGAGLTLPGGYLVLCSCSHAAELERFRASCLAGIGKAGRQAQLLATGGAGPDHPAHAMLAESSYLKALFFRLD
jgi:23S rRNA (cytosine1962-C5)-methyltransferase